MRIDQLATQSPATLQALKEALGLANLDHQTAQLLYNSVALGQHATLLEAALAGVAGSVATAENSANLAQVHAATATGQAGLAAGSAAAAAASAATLAGMESQLDGAVLAAQTATAAATATTEAQASAQAAATVAQASAQAAASEVAQLSGYGLAVRDGYTGTQEEWQEEQDVARIKSLFAKGGSKCAWYNLRDSNRIYTDYNAVNTVESGDPAAIMLDKRLEHARGNDIMTNGMFAGNITGWTLMALAGAVGGGTQTYKNKTLRLKNAATGTSEARTTAPITCVVGKWYEVNFGVVGTNSAGMIAVGTAATDAASIATFAGSRTRFMFKAAATTHYLTLRTGVTTANVEAVFCAISVREVLGNVAEQPTLTARPEYWVEEFTGEPQLWYDLVDDRLLWPSVQGAIGTVAIAYTTGAQVFDLHAKAYLPTGPAVEILFFDYRLSDGDCDFLRAYLDAKVVDSNWQGYVYDKMLVDTWAGAGEEAAATALHYSFRVTFSGDGEKPITAYTASDGYQWEYVPTTPRQRYRAETNAEAGHDSELYPSPLSVNGWSEAKTLGMSFSPYEFMKTNGWWNGIVLEYSPYSYGAPHIFQRRSSNDDLTALCANTAWSYNAAYAQDFLTPLEISMPSGLLDHVYIVSGSQISQLPKAMVENLFARDPRDFIHGFSLIASAIEQVYPDVGAIPGYRSLTDMLTLQNNVVLQAEVTHATSINLSGSNFTGRTISVAPGAERNYNQFAITGCGFVGEIPPVRITGSCYVENNGFTSINPGFTLASSYDPYLYFQNNALNQASIDLLIQKALEWTNGTSRTYARLWMNGGTNATPSATGLANVAALRSLGWNVTHN